MGISQSQAAKKWGVAKGTISKALTNGALSAEKKPDGSYDIDPAEFERWYNHDYRKRSATQHSDRIETLNKDNRNGGLPSGVEGLRERLQMLEELHQREREQLSRQIEDLRGERDDWKQQADKWERQAQAQIRLLEDHRQKEPETPVQPRGGFWARLMGRGA